MPLFIFGISVSDDNLNHSCKEILITAPFVKKYAINSFNSVGLETCKYYALGAKRYAKLMTLRSTKCSCADYKIVETYFYTEKAEMQTDPKQCKKEINIALDWLDKAVNTLTMCKTN
jgi:hypothetical protein